MEEMENLVEEHPREHIQQTNKQKKGGGCGWRIGRLNNRDTFIRISFIVDSELLVDVSHRKSSQARIFRILNFCPAIGQYSLLKGDN